MTGGPGRAAPAPPNWAAGYARTCCPVLARSTASRRGGPLAATGPPPVAGGGTPTVTTPGHTRTAVIADPGANPVSWVVHSRRPVLAREAEAVSPEPTAA